MFFCDDFCFDIKKKRVLYFPKPFFTFLRLPVLDIKKLYVQQRLKPPPLGGMTHSQTNLCHSWVILDSSPASQTNPLHFTHFLRPPEATPNHTLTHRSRLLLASSPLTPSIDHFLITLLGSLYKQRRVWFSFQKLTRICEVFSRHNPPVFLPLCYSIINAIRSAALKLMATGTQRPACMCGISVS